MPTDDAATAAFKRDPIGFLANNMVLPPTQNAERHNHSEHLGLTLLGRGEPVTGLWKAKTAGQAGLEIPLYQVTRAPPGEAYFRSYIADYEQGATTQTTLGTNRHATFCFTANMNGCTFGIGSQNAPGASLVVTHGNAANSTKYPNNLPRGMKPETTKALQNAIQYTQAKVVLNAGASVFEPASYRIGQKMAVTFGYRPDGQPWTFYFISYERTGSGFTPVYVSYGVSPIIANRIEA